MFLDSKPAVESPIAELVGRYRDLPLGTVTERIGRLLLPVLRAVDEAGGQRDAPGVAEARQQRREVGGQRLGRRAEMILTRARPGAVSVPATIGTPAASARWKLASARRVNLAKLKSEPLVLWQREIASRLHDDVIAACASGVSITISS